MKYVVANWKANKNLSEAESWLKTLAEYPSAHPDSELIVAPPYPFLHLVPPTISAAVQDLSPYAAGSYTGAVAARNLIGLGVKYALLGHSERRQYFHETCQEVARKVDQALQNGLTPIVCVDTGYLAEQAAAIADDQLAQCLVAFEPVAAIGSGENVPVAEVSEMKDRIIQLFGEVFVLYGGSVTPANVMDYTAVSDGVLVGTASLDATEFIQLVEMA